MKHNIIKRSFIYVFIPCMLFSCGSNEAKANTLLWYKQPADEWMKAVPLGNGRLGAMVYGGISTETIALNEVTMWSGQPDSLQERACGKERLAEIRQLFFDGKLEEGNKMATKYLAGQPHSFGSHLPIGDLNFNFHCDSSNVTDYRRSLDLEKAVANVSFKIANVTYQREYLCSNSDHVFVIKFTADKKGSIDFDLGVNLLQKADMKFSEEGLEFSRQASFPRQGPG